jgi:hypothetical protein
MDWLGKRQFDLVISTGWAPASLKQYVEGGGRVLIASAEPPEFEVARVVEKSKDMKAYFRVRNHTLFPSLKDTDLLLVDGPYTELEGDGSSSLSLVPPSMIGPPELIHVDMKDTIKPGIINKEIGKGQVVWIPWNLGALYYRVSLPAHAGLFHDVIDRLYPQRQLRTNAHPLVEMTWMQQGHRNLLHLVNLSGHSQTGYWSPLKMTDIKVELAGQFKTAKAVRGGRDIPIKVENGKSEFIVPELSDYELVVVE